MELDEHVPVYVLEPEHLEYHVPSDDDMQDPEEDPSKEYEPEDDDPEEDPSEEHEPKDEDTREEEPSEGSDETEPFEEDKTDVTPPPPRHRGARISVRPQSPMAASTQTLIDAFAAGSSPFPLPPTSPAYDQALLGHREAMIRMRDDILEEDMPPQRRFLLIAPPHGCDVAESSAAATRPPRAVDRVDNVGYLHDAHTDRRDIRLEIDVVRGQMTTYETELHESAEDLAVRQMMRTQVLEARARIDTVEDTGSSFIIIISICIDIVIISHVHCILVISRIMPVTRQGENDAMTPESIQAMIDRAIQRNSTHTPDDTSQSSGGGLGRPVQPARVCSYTDFMKCQPLNFKGTEGVVG
ncbi:hypothetical protein Tco_1462988 [Tanacetum coccineum]